MVGGAGAGSPRHRPVSTGPTSCAAQAGAPRDGPPSGPGSSSVSFWEEAKGEWVGPSSLMAAAALGVPADASRLVLLFPALDLPGPPGLSHAVVRLTLWLLHLAIFFQKLAEKYCELLQWARCPSRLPGSGSLPLTLARGLLCDAAVAVCWSLGKLDFSPRWPERRRWWQQGHLCGPQTRPRRP